MALGFCVLKNGCVSKETSQTSKLRNVLRFLFENRRKPDLQHFKHFVDEVSLPTVDIFCLQEVKKLTGRAKATALFVGICRDESPSSAFSSDSTRPGPFRPSVAQRRQMTWRALHRGDVAALHRHCIASLLAGGKPLRRHLCLFPGTGVVGDDATDR